LVGCGSPKKIVIYFPWAMKLADIKTIFRAEKVGSPGEE
jgi:hypothetical protein